VDNSGLGVTPNQIVIQSSAAYLLRVGDSVWVRQTTAYSASFTSQFEGRYTLTAVEETRNATSIIYPSSVLVCCSAFISHPSSSSCQF
jgi:hypothetical protein